MPIGFARGCRLFGDPLTWTSHPARSRTATAVLTGATVVAVSLLSGVAAGSVLLGSLAFVLVTISLRHFFFRTTYVIDDRGITIRCLGFEARRPWERLRRFRHDEQGAFLSARARPSVLDSFTGLHLTWAGNADEVVPLIERSMAERGQRRSAVESHHAPATAGEAATTPLGNTPGA